MRALQAQCQLIKHALAPLIPVPAPGSNLPRPSTVSTAAESLQRAPAFGPEMSRDEIKR